MQGPSEFTSCERYQDKQVKRSQGKHMQETMQETNWQPTMQGIRSTKQWPLLETTM